MLQCKDISIYFFSLNLKETGVSQANYQVTWKESQQ